jgi:hypothetical protein
MPRLVTKPYSVKRAIYFQMSLPLLADTSQADCYPEFRASKEKYLHIILIGIERYKIPDAVILGG